MGSHSMIDIVVRFIVVLAAATLAIPVLARSKRRLLTWSIFAMGIAMVLVSTAAPVLRPALNLPTGWWMIVVMRLDAPGFAIILLGALRGLRDMGKSRDELARQNRALKEQASTDFLTGLMNRREADSLLEYGAVRARQSGYPVGFIMIDLDHFKQVNDTLGHQAGDAVLAHVGRLLKGHLRSSDIVARYGGEEFLVVVAEPERENIVSVASDLRALIERTPAEHEGKLVPITASLGIAISHVSTERAAREAIGHADAALYAAKARGRNQVVEWDELSADEAAPGRASHLRLACG